jgi:signal transduction histidine kinase
MSIADHGPGVEEDELELITNKFYRGKRWKESKAEGSGLGLYIAKTLIEKMDGELIPESNGDGFTVILMIPLS